MNTLTLCLLTPLFQKQPPPTLFQKQEGGSERERERKRDSMPILLPSPSKDRQQGNYI